DAGHIVRTRLEGIAAAAGTCFEDLDIAVIDVPTLRVDHRLDRQRLLDTVARIRPRLLVLDPLVRLHGIDENAVAEVAPILGFLRGIQRRFGTAVVLVHHARKSSAARPGQALRGSSELHAWGDSNLYLRRRGQTIVMTVEHRAAPGLNDIEIELAEDGHGPALRLRQAAAAETAAPPDTPERRILQALAETDAPLSQRQIRKRAATRPATVASALQGLVRQGRVKHATGGGYRIAGDGGGTTRRPGPLPETVTDPNP
ncbi:MAG: AAA family ATPase, partial [Rhodospirillales bacterium]|nr:AAA family ATPase [Rhodospirillales bacterium]